MSGEALVVVVTVAVAVVVGICSWICCRLRRSRHPPASDKVRRSSTKTRRDPMDALETATPERRSCRVSHGDTCSGSPLGHKLSKTWSRLGTSFGREVPESSQSIRNRDSAAELVLDSRVTAPPPPSWDRHFQQNSSRGASGFFTRALSSMLPVDHKAAARALEEDEDDEDQRGGMVFDDRRLQGLPPAAEDPSDDTQEWWFHLDEHDNILGPLSPSEMRRLYMDGRIGHSTMVRWLPVSFGKPEAAEQPVEGFSPMQELCTDLGPPFMDAPISKPPQKTFLSPKKSTRQVEAEAEEKRIRREAEARARERARHEFSKAAATLSGNQPSGTCGMSSERLGKAEKPSGAVCAESGSEQMIAEHAAGVGATPSTAANVHPQGISPGETAMPEATSRQEDEVLGTRKSETHEGEMQDSELQEEETNEWWFYLDKHNKILGPCSSLAMRRLYMDGRIGHSTLVRWLPVAYSMPEASEQPRDGFSPMQELCTDQGPPFMDAMDADRSSIPDAHVQSRVSRARHHKQGMVQLPDSTKTEPLSYNQPVATRQKTDEADESMRI